jgi:hypothetical protein
MTLESCKCGFEFWLHTPGLRFESSPSPSISVLTSEKGDHRPNQPRSSMQSQLGEGQSGICNSLCLP